jgi:cell division protein FtsX
MIVLLLTAIPVFLIAAYVNIFAGIFIGVLAGMAIFAVFSAAQTIFISSVYNNVTGNIDEHFNQQIIDSLFVAKK